jgi:dual specificity tyrosine-phosphorylation-regulated kinase 1
MVPTSMLDQSGDQQRLQFFEKYRTASGGEEWAVKQQASSSSKSPKAAQRIVPSENPIETLTEVICAETTKKKRYPPSETGNSQRNYEMFIDLIHRMLAYSPEDRIKPEEALNHPFIRSGEQSQSTSPYPQEAALPTASGQRKAGPQNQQD